MPFEADAPLTKGTVAVALKYPSAVKEWVFHGKAGVIAAVLSHLLADISLQSDQQIASLLQSSENNGVLEVPKDLSVFKRSKSLTYILIPYYLTRVFKPEIVVETGVWSGKSTWSILQAMKDNGVGRLFSIDRGLKAFGDTRLPVKEIGGLVPESLRNRWTLIIGDARIELGKLCSDVGPIDMFLHDSDHSYEHMVFEFDTALEAMPVGAILSSDDVNLNDAFSSVSNRLDSIHVIGERFGYGLKAQKAE